MPISLIDEKKAEHARTKLQPYYEKKLIPAEKKPYLTKLDHCNGPFIAVEPDAYVMDAASQIASNGLGFNASPIFGTAHFLESWTNDHDSEEFQAMKKNYAAFLQRKIGYAASMSLCASGSEANEMALGQCYRQRKTDKQKKVLAFEGSFHGRMLISLYSTWNPEKRKQFEWDGKETVFVAYPEMKSDAIQEPAMPEGWVALWEQAPHRDFEFKLGQLDTSDKLLQIEMDCLLKVRNHLATGEFFSILIEPMQCEGGDRYSSSRFHNGLLNLAKAYQVPLIYDEVQTGFSLGTEFFWHRNFQLANSEGQPLFPDFVTCAKRAQTGVVLSANPVHYQGKYASACMVRGYIQGLVLDQYQSKIIDIEKQVEQHLSKLVQQFSEQLEHPRKQGLAFAFDFKDAQIMKQFVAKRFSYGLLYYPAGNHTARFRLNLSFGKAEIEFLFQSLHKVLNDILKGETSQNPSFESGTSDVKTMHAFHQQLVVDQWSGLRSGTVGSSQETASRIQSLLTNTLGQEAEWFQLKTITPDNYNLYRKSIQLLEELAYEPSRQTSLEEFDKVIQSDVHVALALNYRDQLVGIAFAAPLNLFPFVEGARKDPHFNDPQTLYMLDVTIHPEFQGKRLGKVLKYALALSAQAQGIQRIQGRNRDKWAKGMLSINLSLGSYEQQHLEESYADEEPHRSAIYYSNPLQWKPPKLQLSTGLDAPLGIEGLDENYLRTAYPSVLNKMTLSNFINERFMENLKTFLDFLPPSLRHAYTTSGQSECVDKIIKALWYRNKPKRGLLTFDNCFFGEGSFLSRSLYSQENGLFEVESLPFPTDSNWQTVLMEVQRHMDQIAYLAVLVEPLAQQTMERMPQEFLRELRQLCTSRGIALIFNDTASLFYRYSNDVFMSSAGDVKPDGGFAYLGGQMGVVFMDDDHFVEDPLLLISTWDGDEYSLEAFTQAVRVIQQSPDAYFETQILFEKHMRALLIDYPVQSFSLKHGVGHLKGQLPQKMRQWFKTNISGDHYVICPNYSNMKQFISQTTR